MSTEEQENTQLDPEQENSVLENENEQTVQDFEEDPDFDDVPDDVDSAADDTETEETETEQEESENTPEEQAPSDEQETPENGNPFDFLSDLAGNNAEKNPETEKDADTETENTAPENALLGVNLDQVIADLPDGEFKEFAEDYPSEARMAAFMALQVLQKLGFESLQNDVKQFNMQQGELNQHSEQKIFEDAVKKIHPDVETYITGERKFAFASWLKNQSPYIQRSFLSSDPEEAADVVTRYKNSLGTQKKRYNSRNSALQDIKGSASSRQTVSKDDDWDSVPDDSVPEF